MTENYIFWWFLFLPWMPFEIKFSWWHTFGPVKKTIVDFGHGTLLDRCCRLHNVIWLGFRKVRKCHKEGSNSHKCVHKQFINFYLNWTIVIWKNIPPWKNNEFPAKINFWIVFLFSISDFFQSNGPKVCHPRRHGVKQKISSQT